MDDDIEDIYLDNDSPQPPARASRQHGSSSEHPDEYKKFKRVLLGVLLVSLMLTTIRGWELQRLIADFMAVFLVTFAAFKFVDLEAFAVGYRQFDELGKRIRPWAYTVPFIEAFLGFWYLLSEGPRELNVLTLVVTGVAAVGAFKGLKRKTPPSAPLSSVIRVPLVKVCALESGLLFVLAGIMLFL